MAKSVSALKRYTRKQWIVGGVLSVSVALNVATAAFFYMANRREADYWVADYSLQRMCARDMKANILDIKSEANRAFYSVSNCAGWNYKNGTQMGDDLKAMMNKVEATQAPADTVVPAAWNRTFLDWLTGY